MIFKIKQLLNGDNLILFFSFLFILYCTYILSEDFVKNIRKKFVRYFKYNVFFDKNFNVRCSYCFCKLKNKTKYKEHIAIYFCHKCLRYIYIQNKNKIFLTEEQAIAGIKKDMHSHFRFGCCGDTNSQI